MKTKMTAIFATLMIALMAVGFAYAHWSKIITINGTITTGKLHLYPTFSATTDDKKGICKVTWDIDIAKNSLTVTIDKAYPCITVSGKFDLHNDGTIPAGLNSWTFTIYGVKYDIYPGVISPSMTEDQVETALETWVKTQAGGAVTVTVDFAGSNFWQIHPGEEPKLDFTIHFEEDLLQDKTFTFAMALEYYNWNEAASTR
jgi:hypothetical protein